VDDVHFKLSYPNIKLLLEECVAQNEGNTALIYHQKSLTYKELNSRANKIANFLIARGVKTEDLIAVYLESGIELIMGLIAVLKSGAAYVPIDPDYPVDKTSYILDDCGAKTIITTNALKDKLTKLTTADVIAIDDDLLIEGFSEQSPVVLIKPGDLAYVMYTSGTTGMPNGVMVEHAGVVNNLLWAKKYFNTGPDEIVLQKTTFCFDVSVWEIFWPLISGSTLIIVNKGDYRDLNNLKHTIEHHKVTTIHFVPTMLEIFLTSINIGDCDSIKRVVCSGEALTPFQANLLKNKIPGSELHNLYGPTEATIHSTYWQVPDTDYEIDKVLIGKPIDDTEILILNEDRQQIQDGGIGEIYIGGRGVARGYLNKSVLTSGRFVIRSIDDDNAGRFFKTGDFGRFTGDGNIEYLGRIDDQVKVNGYRIELESIETMIKNSGVVKHAVALTRKNNLGFIQIVAWVTLNSGRSIQDIWNYLVTKLPGYMLPTNIREVENIPFTHNGKVDKDLLLNALYAENLNNGSVMPRSELENTVFNIWKALFKRDDIGIYDNFFDIGGNSILAVKMLSQLKKSTDRHISFILLNQYPTIESLAKLLDKPTLPEIPNILISIKPQGSKPPIYLVNGGGLVNDGFFNLSDELDDDQPVYGFQSNGYDSNGNMFERIEEIAAQYIKSILENDPSGPYCIAGYSLGGVIAFEMARQLKASGKEIRLLAMIDGLTRDPELIKTKYNLVTILRIIGLNIYLLKNGPNKGFNYTKGVVNAVIRKIAGYFVKRPGKEIRTGDAEKDIDFDIFNLHVSAYRKYTVQPYDGNVLIFRAKDITFYMDDFKYLGWKQFAKKVKSIPISGSHFSLFDNSNIKGFGNKLQDALNEGF
jgi:amino acid adenylation domain-containing protein